MTTFISPLNPSESPPETAPTMREYNTKTIFPPSYRKASFPCQTIDKIVDEDVIPTLNTTERKALISELSQALETVNNDIRAYSDPSRQTPNNPSWIRKARFVQENLSELLYLARAYEKEREPTMIELKAQRRYAKGKRRFQRQRLQIDSFLELVAKDLGEDRLRELLIESSDLAEERADNWEDGNELPEDPFNGE